ncbi:MAG: helix-turn-helix domain-containing protein [Kiritimatiellia bacterium]|nr:helix-turn-helix domain-containing protein [Lentisphaerota bacterium]
MAKSELVQSLQRALDVLEKIGLSEDGIRLAELADQLALKKTTVYNLARTLQARGYLARDNAGRYQLGPMLDEIAQRRFQRRVFRRAAAAMQHLYASYQNAVLTFSELIGSEICCRIRMAPDFPGLLRQPPMQTFQPFSSASGLCLQAFNANYRENMAATGGFDESARCWNSRADFEKALEATRQSGLAIITSATQWRLAAPIGDNYVLGISLPGKTGKTDKLAEDLAAAVEDIRQQS